MATIFDLSKSGNGSCGSELWIDLGVINSGYKWWFGSLRYASLDKTISFDLRSNNSGQSTGTLANTTSIYKASVSPRNGQILIDVYKKGRLHTATILGTGAEHCWLRLSSKSGSLGEFMYQIAYCLE